MELDGIDRKILNSLQSNGRVTLSEISDRVDMSSAAVHGRVTKLEEAGVIEGYHAKVDPKALGYTISAVVGLQVEQGQEHDIHRLEDIPEVREIHLTTGSWDALMHVFAEDADALRELMFETITQMEGFARSQMMVILGTPYETEQFPINAAES